MFNKSKHHIEVSSVALADLKAEISRRQVEVRQRAQKHPDGFNVIRNASDTLNNKKSSIWRKTKTQLNEDKVKLESQPIPTDAQELAEWERIKKNLEAKEKLYNALAAAAASGKSNCDKLYKSDDGDILVDFDQKVDEVNKNRSRSSSMSSDEGNRSQNYDAACEEDEWEDYTDERGIKRTCMRKDHPDTNNTEEHRSDEPLTYAHLREGEIRDHGTGFYGFSQDAEKREAEMNRLRDLHRATEEGRARAQIIRAKRDAKMGLRLARLRSRKGLPDVATAAAQCLNDMSVPNTPAPVSAESQFDIKLGNDDLDVASMLRRLRDEAEKRTELQNRKNNELVMQSNSTNIQDSTPRYTLSDVFEFQTGINTTTLKREWDRGKSMISAQRYAQLEREKRVSDFAPPSKY